MPKKAKSLNSKQTKILSDCLTLGAAAVVAVSTDAATPANPPNMSDTPADVLQEILSRVPAESLLRFRCVCKRWKDIIDNPLFIRSHTRHLQQHSLATILVRESEGGGICSVSLDRLNDSFPFQTLEVDPLKKLILDGVPRLVDAPAASCNGLILISNRRVCKGWAIWNPLTRQLHEVSHLGADFPSLGGCSVSVGFGYEDAADDYKVVRIDKLQSGGATVCYRTLVYSMKLRSWRKIQDCPYNISFVGDGVFLNGALHWQSRDGVTVLHLGKEEFSVLPRPLRPLSKLKFATELLDALDGYLFLSYYPENKSGLDVWVMEDYRVPNSWMKLCSIVFPSGADHLAKGLRPVAYSKSKRQVFLGQCRGGLYWLDLEDNSATEVAIEGYRSVSFSQFSPSSLLRLDHADSAVVQKPKGGFKRKRREAYGRLKLKFCLRATGEMLKVSV